MKWRWYILVRWARSLRCLLGGHRPLLHLGDKTERSSGPARTVHKFRNHGCPRCGAFFVERV